MDINITKNGEFQDIGSVIKSKNSSDSENYQVYSLLVTWRDDSTVTLSGDVTVSIGESTFVYTQK